VFTGSGIYAGNQPDVYHGILNAASAQAFSQKNIRHLETLHKCTMMVGITNIPGDCTVVCCTTLQNKWNILTYYLPPNDTQNTAILTAKIGEYRTTLMGRPWNPYLFTRSSIAYRNTYQLRHLQPQHVYKHRHIWIVGNPPPPPRSCCVGPPASSSNTEFPASDSFLAITLPAGPAPTMMKSKLCSSILIKPKFVKYVCMDSTTKTMKRINIDVERKHFFLKALKQSWQLRMRQ